MGMKKTEVGMIPEEWNVQIFSDTFRILNNNTFSRAELNYESGQFKNIHYGDVLIRFPEVLDCTRLDVPYINDDCRISGSAQALQDGDVVIADTAEDETVGKVTEVRNTVKKPVMAGLHTIPCRVKSGEFAPMCLGYYMNSHLYHDQLLPYIHGIKVSSVSKGSLAETVIIKPPIEEQKKIVAALSDMDALIKNTEKLIRKYQAVKQACLQRMFPQNGQNEPEMRLPGFTGAWEQRKLGDLAEIGDIDHKMPKSVSEGIPYLMTGDFIGNNELNFNNVKEISEEDYETLSRKIRPEKGDILFARYASVGAVRYVDFSRKFIISYSCAIIKENKKINSKYLYHYLTTDDAQRQIKLETKTGSQANIGIDSMKNSIVIPMPDEFEQEKISVYLSNLDHLIALHQRKLKKYKDIKQGMMEELLTGKVRLS